MAKKPKFNGAKMAKSVLGVIVPLTLKISFTFLANGFKIFFRISKHLNKKPNMKEAVSNISDKSVASISANSSGSAISPLTCSLHHAQKRKMPF